MLFELLKGSGAVFSLLFLNCCRHLPNEMPSCILFPMERTTETSSQYRQDHTYLLHFSSLCEQINSYRATAGYSFSVQRTAPRISAWQWLCSKYPSPIQKAHSAPANMWPKWQYDADDYKGTQAYYLTYCGPWNDVIIHSRTQESCAICNPSCIYCAKHFSQRCPALLLLPLLIGLGEEPKAIFLFSVQRKLSTKIGQLYWKTRPLKGIYFSPMESS